MTEKELQNKFVNWLNYHQIEYLKIHSGKIYLPQHTPAYMGKNSYNGDFYSLQLRDSFSDLLVFFNGEVLFIELKRDGGYLKKNQREQFYTLFKNGFRNNCFVLRPKNWESFKYNFKNTKNLKASLLLTLGANNWASRRKLIND